MPSLKALGIAALGLLPACENSEKPIEQSKPAQQVIPSACERFHTAIGVESAIEQVASDPVGRKLIPPTAYEAAWKEVHAGTMAALKDVQNPIACLQTFK